MKIRRGLPPQSRAHLPKAAAMTEALFIALLAIATLLFILGLILFALRGE